MKASVDDPKLEAWISQWLRAGLMLSAAVVTIGGTLFLLRHGRELTSYRPFHGEPPEYRSFPELWRSMAQGHPRALIQAGILLLIVTPMFRVALSLVGFALERDWLYVGCTLLVLAILLVGLSHA